MIKYFFKNNSQEVKVGDVLTITTIVKAPWKTQTFTNKLKVTEALMASFIKEGVVRLQEDKKEDKKETSCNRCIKCKQNKTKEKVKVIVLGNPSNSEITEALNMLKKRFGPMYIKDNGEE